MGLEKGYHRRSTVSYDQSSSAEPVEAANSSCYCVRFRQGIREQSNASTLIPSTLKAVGRAVEERRECIEEERYVGRITGNSEGQSETNLSKSAILTGLHRFRPCGRVQTGLQRASSPGLRANQEQRCH